MTTSYQVIGNPPIKFEMDKYQKTRRPKNGGNTDTLTWWKQHATILSGVARFWLSIPPTSSSSERAFFISTLVIIDRNYNLDSDKADKLFFITQNYFTFENHVKKWSMEPESEHNNLNK